MPNRWLRSRQGAARLALGARAAGVGDLHLVPVGIHYEDKAGIRSRAYVHVGDVMDLDAELASMGIAPVADAEDHEAVHHLTTDIEARLRRSAPDYSSDQEARRLLCQRSSAAH